MERRRSGLAVSGYWTRSNDVEVDLIGAERDAVADHIDFVGSIKWHDERGFDNHDLVDLLRGRDRVPGADRSRSPARRRRFPTRLATSLSVSPVSHLADASGDVRRS